MAPARQDYFLPFLLLAFFLVDAFLAEGALAVAFLAAGAAELLLLPLLNADSQPSEYFFVAPTRTIVTVVSLESFLFLHHVRPPRPTPAVQLP